MPLNAVFFLFQKINNFQLCKVIENSNMTENSNMNSEFTIQNSDEDISDLESSKSHMLALFATLGKKETDLKNEKQKLKVELNESQKKNEDLLQEIEKVKGEKQTLQKNLEDVQNEKEQKDTQIESLNLELTEIKKAIQSFLSGEITLKSLSNLVKTSATPEIVPKQGENVQRAEMSQSNDEEEQVSDQMPDQQAVQTPDGQLPTFPQSEVQEQPMEGTQFERVQRVQISYLNEGIEQIHDQIPGQVVQTPDGKLQTMSEEKQHKQQQQPMEVTQHESIMETLPTQVLSQPVVKTESSFHDENDNTNLLEPEIDLPICNETHQLGLIL